MRAMIFTAVAALLLSQRPSRSRKRATTFSRTTPSSMRPGRQSRARAGYEYDNRAFPAPHVALFSAPAGRGRIRRAAKRAIAAYGELDRAGSVHPGRTRTLTFPAPGDHLGQDHRARDIASMRVGRLSLFVGAAGGGVWAPPMPWRRRPHGQVSTTAFQPPIGSLLIDPTDSSARPYMLEPAKGTARAIPKRALACTSH